MSSVPVLTYGRHASIAEAVAEGLKPEYDAVHSIVDFQAALSEIPTILSGDLTAPAASGLGSNVQRLPNDRRVPKAVVFGGGIPPEEVQQIKDLVTAKKIETVWIKVDPATIMERNPEAVAKGTIASLLVPECKRSLKEAGL